MAILQETNPQSRASIVIPTFKRGHLAISLAKQIRRIYKKIEIIVVDQENNNPPSIEEIEKLDIRYFNLKKANTSEAKNRGIKEAQGEIVIFFDDDVKITKTTIANHLKTYADPHVIGTCGRVINDKELIPQNTLVDTGKTNFLGTKFLIQFWSTKNQSIDFPYGCNMSFRKSALDRIKGFDPHFPKIFEEVDLGYRIKKLGQIKFVAEALVYHHKAATGGIRPEEIANKQKLIFRNYGYYLAKNVSFPFSIISLVMRIRTALLTAPFAVFDLINGYFQKLILENLLIIIVFSLIIILRLWKVPDFFIFTFSEEWLASLAWEQVKNFHIIWIGVSQANINYYLGPGFIYLNYLIFLIAKGDPVILAYSSAILGIITAIFLYYITKDLFNRKVALTASLIYGCSTLINYYDRRFWNASVIPLFSLLFIYSLIKASKDTRWLILTAVLIGAAFHFHLILLIFLLPTSYIVIKNFRKIKWNTWVMMVAIYLILTLPLMVFDFVHNFDNLLVPYKLLFGKGKNSLYPMSLNNIFNHFQALLSTFGRIWFVKLNTSLQEIALETNTSKIPGNLLFASLSIIPLFWFFLKNRKFGYQIFFIFISTILLAFLVYPSYNPEYYLMGFFAVMAIVIGFWLNALPKIISYPIIAIFIIANVLTVISTTSDHGLTMKKRMIEKTMAIIKNQDFSLEATGTLPNPQYAYAGWRFLFKAYGKTPTHSNVDSVLGWIYQDEIPSVKPKLHVVISESPVKLKQKPIAVFNEGVYWGYILNNF